MNLYMYSKYNGEYLGEVKANKDPLESEIQGKDILVIPPYCTTIAPKDTLEGSVNVFDEEKGAWDIVQDNRGIEVYNKKTGVPIVINQLGPVPSGYSKNKPYILQDEKIKELSNLNVVYGKAQQAKIQIGKVRVSIDDRIKLTEVLKQLDSAHPNYYFDMEDESVLLNIKEIKEITEKLYKRALELPEKRNELVARIKGASSKKALEEVKAEVEEFAQWQ